MDSVTASQLAEWQRLCDKATPGPWPIEPNIGSIGFGVTGADDAQVGVTLRKRDAEFIAAARDALPALLAEVARLRETAEIGLALAEAWIHDHTLDEHPSPKKAAERMASLLGVPNWREKKGD